MRIHLHSGGKVPRQGVVNGGQQPLELGVAEWAGGGDLGQHQHRDDEAIQQAGVVCRVQDKDLDGLAAGVGVANMAEGDEALAVAVEGWRLEGPGAGLPNGTRSMTRAAITGVM